MPRTYAYSCEFVNKRLEVCRRPANLRKCAAHLGSSNYRPCHICNDLTANILPTCSKCEIHLKKEWWEKEGANADEETYVLHYLTHNLRALSCESDNEDFD